MYSRLLKQIFTYAVALCLLLCLAVSLAENASGNGSLFSVIAATQGTEAAWELVTDIPRNRYMQQGYASLSVWSPDSPVSPGLSSEKDAPTLQSSYSVNIMETNGTGFTITDVEVWGYELSEDCFIRSPYPIVNVQGQHVPAYGMFTFYGMQPAMGNFHYHVYVVYGVDDNGHEQEFYGLVEFLNYGHEMLNESNVAYDTHNLRSEADFEVEVAQGVWWVPAISLAGTDYSNYEIAAMVNESPETKQASLDTLYEALPLASCQAKLEQRDSLCIGDVVIGCTEAVVDPQIYVCVREGDTLMVQDVICAEQYQTAFQLGRDADGQWQKTQDCWYLMRGQVAGVQFQVAGRMFCDVDTAGLDRRNLSE